MPPSTRRLDRSKPLLEASPDATSITLSKPFPFLDLPDTVRQRFYEIQLEAQRGFVRFYSKAGPYRCKVTPAKVKINIMLTCRRVCEEAMPVLYRINNFCVLPLNSDAEQNPRSEEDVVFVVQNNRWICGMPLKGRNLINRLELALPLPPASGTDHPYKNVRELFPGLRSLTLFLDFVGQSFYGCWALPEPEDYLFFYQKLQIEMPHAREIFLDSRMLKAPEWQPLIDTVLKVWDASPGRSAFISQDLHHANLYESYRKELEMSLADRLGPRGLNYQRLSYWDVRVNQVNNRDDYPTDDDTDDEIECFEKFDAEKIVARIQRHSINMEHVQFASIPGEFWSIVEDDQEIADEWSYW